MRKMHGCIAIKSHCKNNGRMHIKIISVLRSSSHFAQAECSPLEVCLNGTFKIQKPDVCLAFFWLLPGCPFLNDEYEKGPCGPLVIFLLILISAQAGAETLDAYAGFFQQLIRGCIGNAEVRAEAECRTMNNRHAFGFQKFRHKSLSVSMTLPASVFCRSALRRTDRHRTRLPASGTGGRLPG
ncbi:Uncharacterised protein [Brucella melitensis]|nr:Uncharacterised protein [Brucella melitensis]